MIGWLRITDCRFRAGRSFNASTYGRTMPIKGSTLTSSLKHRAVAESKRERGGGTYISNEALRRQLQLGIPATVE